jgi:DUF4097 and DUF4098 domain-containing protein YvlB
MKRTAKILLIVAITLIVIGLIVFVIAMSAAGWDFSKLGSANYETNTVEITADFDNLFIESKTADITLRPSDDGSCKVVCREQENRKHTVAVEDRTLSVRMTESGKWYDFLSFFSFGSPTITVYLPEKTYAALTVNTGTGRIELPGGFTFHSIDISGSTGDVVCGASSEDRTRIALSTGSITLSGASAGAYDLSVSTGDVRMDSVITEGDITVTVTTGRAELGKISCRNLYSSGTTGDLSLSQVLASDAFSITRSTGSIRFDQCDAEQLAVRTTTGDVRGTLLSDKVFLTETTTGSVSVPKTTAGGRCEISTRTGDIEIGIEP